VVWQADLLVLRTLLLNQVRGIDRATRCRYILVDTLLVDVFGVSHCVSLGVKVDLLVRLLDINALIVCLQLNFVFGNCVLLVIVVKCRLLLLLRSFVY